MPLFKVHQTKTFTFRLKTQKNPQFRGFFTFNKKYFYASAAADSNTT